MSSLSSVSMLVGAHDSTTLQADSNIPVSIPTIASINFTQVDIAGGGVALVITGTNLLGATAVNIGGSPTTPSSSTATTVTFSAPAHASGTGLTVTVTTPGGTSNNLPGNLEYWSPTQITGVTGVFDANKGASISSWADHAGVAGAATQGTGAQQPTVTSNAFGTLAGLTFGGSQRMGLGARQTMASALSAFFVAKWTSSKATPTDYVGNAALTIVGDGSGGVQGGLGVAAGTVQIGDANGSTQYSRGSGLNDGNPHLVGWTFDTGNQAKAYVGASQAGANQAFTYNTGWGWNTIGAGFLNAGNGDGFSGTLGAVITGNAVFSSGDITKLNLWAQQRWGTP